MHLQDLQPKWWAEPDRHGQGVLFQCPHCVALAARDPKHHITWLCVAFSNPLDGGSPWKLTEAPRPLWTILYPGEDFDGLLEKGEHVVPPGTHWRRTGDTFESLTLWPSVDASPAGCWHGFVEAGGIR